MVLYDIFDRMKSDGGEGYRRWRSVSRKARGKPRALRFMMIVVVSVLTVRSHKLA